MTTIMKAIEVTRERTSIPTPREFEIGPNPNYFDSLIAGCLSPILHLPQILWFNSLWPFLKSIFNSLQFILVSFGAGITGKANGFRVVNTKERELTDQEKEDAVRAILAGTGFVARPLNGSKETSEEDSTKQN